MTTALRIFLGLIAVAVTVIGLVTCWYAEEDYRGARLWTNTRLQLEARGESLELAHFIPPRIPDAQNLAMAPLFGRLYDYQVDHATGLLTFDRNANEVAEAIGFLPYGKIASGLVRPSSRFDWTTAHALDLSAFQDYYRADKDFPSSAEPQSAAEDVLLALTRYDSTLNELAEAAAARPLTRFPVNWTQRYAAVITLPHGNFIQAVNQAIRLRACAELILGRTSASLRDISLGFRLCESLNEEPTTLSELVEMASLNLLFQPLWDGLAARRFSAPQLRELQAMLHNVDLLKCCRTGMQAERAFIIVPFRDELRKPGGFKNLVSMQAPSPDSENATTRFGNVAKVYPRGWADISCAVVCQLLQTNLVDPVDVVRPPSFC